MSAKGSNAAHSALVDAIMLKIGALPYCRVWKQVTGLFYQVRWNELGKVDSTQAVKVGTDGWADIGGIIRRWDNVGQVLQVEAKTGQAVQNADQKRWEAMVRSMGGIYLLARTPEEALELVERERNRGRPDGAKAP